MSNNAEFLLYVFSPAAVAMAVYWYFYVSFIEQLRKVHPGTYLSLDRPTEMDSEFKRSNHLLWGYIYHLQFRSLKDTKLNILGFGVIITGVACILISIYCITSWNASH